MKEAFYITQSGSLKRKDNTLLFENKKIKKVIPIEGIRTIYALGEIEINSKLVNFLSQKGILLHYFNYYGYYAGTFYPKESNVSGALLVKQVNFYTNNKKRLVLAQKFVLGLLNNLIFILTHYYKHGCSLRRVLNKFNKLGLQVKEQPSIYHLLQIEGKTWEAFYSSFDKILPKEFTFNQRTKRPPQNKINSLISFGNSLLYTNILSQIYKTQLNPTISYLHEPSTQRFSLSLDLSEVFKPNIVFRTIFKLVNKNMLKEKHFCREGKACFLNEQGRRKFLIEFDKRLNKKSKHPKLRRKTTNRTLFKLECYKLIKHFLGESVYQPFNLEKGA